MQTNNISSECGKGSLQGIPARTPGANPDSQSEFVPGLPRLQAPVHFSGATAHVLQASSPLHQMGVPCLARFRTHARCRAFACCRTVACCSVLFALLLGLFACAGQHVRAQQPFTYTQYMDNLAPINATYSLLDKAGAVHALVRNNGSASKATRPTAFSGTTFLKQQERSASA